MTNKPLDHIQWDSFCDKMIFILLSVRQNDRATMQGFPHYKDMTDFNKLKTFIMTL